jgi:hypothetical protein
MSVSTPVKGVRRDGPLPGARRLPVDIFYTSVFTNASMRSSPFSMFSNDVA